MSRKIYVVGSQVHYANWMEGELVDNLKDADLVIFTGGADVSPQLYNENAHPTTSCDPTRDKFEVTKYLEARSMNKKVIGICRGSQFLCVMAGGRLVQDQQNPLFIHPIETIEGKVIRITSTHHQAQYPFFLQPSEYKLIGWTKGISRYHKNGRDQEVALKDNKEAEIVYYPKINALGIQGHPEMLYNDKDKYSDTFEYFRDLLNKFMNNEI